MAEYAGLIERVKRFLISPKAAWAEVEGEPADTGGLIKGYLLPLAAASAVAAMLGMMIFGRAIPLVGRFRVPFGRGLISAVLEIALTIVGAIVIGKIIQLLGPTFSAAGSEGAHFKVAVYTYTPALVAGILRIIPALGIIMFLGWLYGLYLLYLGLGALMKPPKEKVLVYTIVVVIVAVVVQIVIGAVVGALAWAGMGATMPGLG